jgi:N-acetylglucosamine-6-sulfatase
LGQATATDDLTILNRMRMMRAVDEGLGRILESLERARQLDDTVVMFTSDHGYFYGEHGLNAERRLAYEETIRIPLLVRFPRLFRAGARPEHLTLSVDVAATALALAGVRPTVPLHGRPLNTRSQRAGVLIEYFSDTVFPRIRNMGYQAIRTDRWKYIRYQELKDSDEVYDLRNDPFELNNLHGDARAPLAQLQRQLDRLLRETGASARA